MFTVHEALKPRERDPRRHVVLGTALDHEPRDGQEVLFLAAGCYWGVEKILWSTPGVVATAVGFMGGHAEHPTYEQVCTDTTGHAETVRVVHDPSVITTGELLALFFEIHDPTQGDRQGGDIGSQYRSAIWTTTPEQYELALRTRAAYEARLAAEGLSAITTTIAPASEAGRFWEAHEAHQGYLWKNPDGYQCHSRTGIACPVVGSHD